MSNIIQTQKRPDYPVGIGSVEERLRALETWQIGLNSWLDVQQRRVAQGIWTPTATIITNLDTVTVYPCYFIVVDRVVFCAGKFDSDATATGATSFRMSLPIPAVIVSNDYIAGNATSNTATQTIGSRVFGIVANNEAVITGNATNTNDISWSFNFAYRLS